MKITSSQGLPYPQINDPGDGALDLQVLAEAIDAKATAQLAGYRSVLNDRQVDVMTTTVDNSAIGANVKGFVTYNSSLYSAGTAPTFPSFEVGSTAGIYVIGAYQISNPTGAVTLNSFRDLFIEVRLYQGAVLNTFITETYQSRVYETNTGGEHQTLVCVVNVPDPSNSTVVVQFQHANAASSAQVKAGSIFWIYQVGTVD